MIYNLTNIIDNVIILLHKEVYMDRNNEYSAQKNDVKKNRFKKIAESRVNKILTNLDSLGKCSNTRNYEYTDVEVRKIFREIERKVKEVKIQFQGESRRKGRFRLG